MGPLRLHKRLIFPKEEFFLAAYRHIIWQKKSGKVNFARMGPFNNSFKGNQELIQDLKSV